MIGLFLIGAALAGADKTTHRCDAGVGVGNHSGLAGLSFSCDLMPYLGFQLGAGAGGEAVSLRWYPKPYDYPGLYAALGYAPVTFVTILDETYAIVGTTLTGGYVKRKGRLSLTGAIGLGYGDLGLLGSTTEVAFDAVIGLNFGKAKAPANSTVKVCDACGREAQDGDQFCPNDGTELSE